MTITPSDKVRGILAATPRDYLKATANLHLGSYPHVNDAEMLIYRLHYENNWAEYSHPSIMEGCQGYIAPIPGLLAVVSVDDLKPDDVIRFSDPKGTGFAMGTVNRRMFKKVEHTVLIAGMDQGKMVCFTFHAGDPIRPSTLPASEWNNISMKVSDVKNLTKLEYVRLSAPA